MYAYNYRSLAISITRCILRPPHTHTHTHTHTHVVFLNIVKNTEDDRITPPGLHMPKWLPCQQCRRKAGSDTE